MARSHIILSRCRHGSSQLDLSSLQYHSHTRREIFYHTFYLSFTMTTTLIQDSPPNEHASDAALSSPEDFWRGGPGRGCGRRGAGGRRSCRPTRSAGPSARAPRRPGWIRAWGEGEREGELSDNFVLQRNLKNKSAAVFFTSGIDAASIYLSIYLSLHFYLSISLSLSLQSIYLLIWKSLDLPACILTHIPPSLTSSIPLSDPPKLW